MKQICNRMQKNRADRRSHDERTVDAGWPRAIIIQPAKKIRLEQRSKSIDRQLRYVLSVTILIEQKVRRVVSLIFFGGIEPQSRHGRCTYQEKPIRLRRKTRCDESRPILIILRWPLTHRPSLTSFLYFCGTVVDPLCILW